MEAVDPEANLGGNDDQSHKRPGLAAGDDAVTGGEAKRPREEKIVRHNMGMEMEEEEMGDQEVFEIYRKDWIFVVGKSEADFYKPTEMPPMRHTDGPLIPIHLKPMEAMEVFFVKVAHLTGGLQWPLDVYGDVAVRDSLDHMRNYLFRRGRNDCQTLTSLQDSLLELIGPSRAIVLLDEPVFEIDLKVKGRGSSSPEEEEDKVLCLHYFGYNNIAYYGTCSRAITRTEPAGDESCTAMEFRFAHLLRAVEATITARVIDGSGGSFGARFTAHTTGAAVAEDEVVLLDSRGGEVAVAGDDGSREVVLRRRVVAVEDREELIIGMEARLLGGGGGGGGGVVVQTVRFYARPALRSLAYFIIGPIRIEVVVAWSLLPLFRSRS